MFLHRQELSVNALTPRFPLCVQRSCRPLLERPETAVKFSRTERRGGASAREDEPRSDERAEQQAPAPQGPVLPPPPPVDYGVFLQGLERADVWWASLLHTQFEDGAIDVAWDEFVRLFRAKFVPEHVQDRMEQEFLSLAQGSMTVLEYEARFYELSKYAHHIVTDEHRKIKKFVMGLKPSLRMRLVAFDHHTLDEALSAACRQAGEKEQYLEEKKASQKRPAATFQRQDKKTVVYPTQPRSVAVGNSQERADVWWASLLHTRFEDGAIDVAWDEFVRLFWAKFVPEHVQDRMEQEFLYLAQGSMTVLEYEARFSELSKYAPHIMTDERRKTKKFVMGLKPSLRTRLVAFDHRTLDEALSTACRQEGEMEQYLEEKKASQKRPAATFQRQDKKKAVYRRQLRSVAVGNSQVPRVSPLWEDTWWFRMLDDYRKLSLRSSVLDEVIEQQKADPRLLELVGKADIARDEDGVSTIWTPTLIPASSDVDANFSGLHALQSRKSREQATPTIGELSPTTYYLLRRTCVVGDDTLAEEVVETDSERGD
ncbi:hypothetical protein Taro_038897 [Colocasia esculenta]|uniref:Retrotransposon gag domain-containing protein n=1 Tax=Colocasia esculenta TaxID=4460 RepID=A0A843WE51_COLES|nr:hypothetical protein [Colocasia esculenta]